jgi:hypothetical protein
VVVHTLHEVAHQLGVEERHRQLQELDEEVAHQRDVDSHGDVQQQPAADEIDGRTAHREHQLSQEYQPDKADVLVLDAHVHDALREERKDELQQAAHEQAQDDLPEVTAVLLDVTKEKLERAFLPGLSVCLLFIKRRGRFQKHGYSLRLTARLCAYPVLLELFKTEFYKPLPRVGNVEDLSLLDLV